ncbi:hypothetical protein MBLNU13_g10524t2 [Cladosporium sp. NU13]
MLESFGWATPSFHVCEHTINIPEGNKGSNRHHKNAGEVHVINNFLEDQRFCDRPYVKKAPHARFYAGVPIQTPNGARIGAYCVLDDKPRDGVSDDEVDFLKHMADLVMRHLGKLRESAEFGRGAKMLVGLGVIAHQDDENTTNTLPIEGVADRVEGSRLRRSARSAKPTRSPSPPSSYTPMLSEYASDFVADTENLSKKRLKSLKQQGQHTSDPTPASDTIANKTLPETAKPTPESSRLPPPFTRARPSDESSSSHHTDGNDSRNTLDKQIRQSFQRASALLLDAVKSDGVIFLDATAARSPNNDVTSRRFTSLSVSSTESSDNSAGSDAPRIVTSGVKCDVLGHSEVDGRGGVPSFENMITERFLTSLMRRYPKGKTWTFDADGQESSETFLQDLAGSVPEPGNATSATLSRTLRETPKLQRLFSLGLRTLCFAPMWDPVRERWYAAALTWSKSPQHGFSKASELSYLNAFCDVTMAEVLRIESKQEAKSRAALMSSFSHDLRSPLHGILGSIDLLKGSATLDWSLVEQVQKCSLNLVDVIDHLLDFAQINNKATLQRTSDHQREITAGKGPIRNVNSNCVSLSSTTEAIVDSVFYSHYFTKHDRTQPHVDLVMDLTPDSGISCMISVGAWKRLCTNIVNNALKYTASGHVKVSLDVSTRETGEKQAVLTVSDTGIGMSPEFLQQRLFKSFAQEDTFAMGTGLGMSLVAELIKEFGGEIEVTSKKGAGTTMTVTIPLETPQEDATKAVSFEPDLSDIRVAFCEPDGTKNDVDKTRRPLTNAVKRTLRNIGVTVSSSNDTSIIALLEEHFEQSPSDMQIDKHLCLVLCDSFASATRLRERFQGANVEFVPQPYGPGRLSSALQTLRKSLSEGTELSSVPTSPPSGAIDLDSSSSFKYRRSRSLSALPAALDESLERLTLSSPNANTVKAETHEITADSNDQLIPHTTDSTSENAVSGGRDPFTCPPHDESPRRPDQLLLLLVDDNPINLKLLSMVADRNHYPRLLASNGQEAVDAYITPKEASQPKKLGEMVLSQSTNKRPDVVLLDLNMPVMNGFEAARQIRQFEKQTGAPPAVIIAITGLGDDIARAKAYQHGFNFFMSKPVRPKDVTDMLESIIETKSKDG